MQNDVKAPADHFPSVTDVSPRVWPRQIGDSIVMRRIKRHCWRRGKHDVVSWIIGHPIKIKSFLIVTSWSRHKDTARDEEKQMDSLQQEGKDRQSWLTSTTRTFWWQHVGRGETEKKAIILGLRAQGIFFRQSLNRSLKGIILIGMCTKPDLGIFAPAETSVTLTYLRFCKCFPNWRMTTETRLKVAVLACVQCTVDRTGLYSNAAVCSSIHVKEA